MGFYRRFLSILLIVLARINALQTDIDKTLAIRQDSNVKVIPIGYIAGTTFRPNLEFFTIRRYGRYVSGALTYAIHKINKMAQNGENNSLIPQNYQISLKFVETYGDAKTSVREVANMCVANETWAIIGPQESCRTEADIAAAYNMLMISHFCTDNILSMNNPFQTFISTVPRASGLVYALISFLKHFNWTSISLVISNHPENQYLVDNCITGLKAHNFTVLHKRYFWSPAIYGTHNDHFAKIVNQTYQSSRIYVFIGADYEAIALLQRIYEKGLTDTGDYFVVAVLLRNEAITHTLMKSQWKNSKEQNKKLIRNFVIINHIKSEEEYVEELRRNFKFYLTLPPFNLASANDSQPYIPIQANYLFDAVWLYATALGKVLRNPKLGSPRNGTLLKSLLVNYEYKSELGYINRLDSMGGAQGNYTVNQIIFDKNDTLQIQTVGLFQTMRDNPQRLVFKYFANRHINWIRDRPSDIPECGFSGELCLRSDNNHKTILILAVFFVASIIVLILIVFKIRSDNYEKELERLLWKIGSSKEIEFCEANLLGKFSYIKRPPLLSTENDCIFLPMDENKNPLITRSSCLNIDMLSQFTQQNSRMRMGVFKSQDVVVKRIYIPNDFSLTRKIKKELKSLREISFPNLNRFMGAIIEHQETYVVWEFCDHGSLQDVLCSTSLITDHPVFLSSFTFDIISGLNFLHENPNIGFHGHLKSSNCLVDSRWTLKLSGYGMTEFLSHSQPPSDITGHNYFLSLFWTAPEIIRFYVFCKYQKNSFLEDLRKSLLNDRKLSGEKRSDETSSLFSNRHDSDNVTIHFAPSDSSFLPDKLDTTVYQKGDIFSFCMIFYELHSCQMPYFSNYYLQNSPREIIRRVIVLNDEFKVPYRPKLGLISRTDHKVTDLIQTCWQENSNQRPNTKVIYSRLKMIFGEKKNLVEVMKEKMTLYTRNLEKEVMRRTEELREEKKQNEELLYQMLPVSVAEQLRQRKQVEAEAFDCVSIYFSDIVGFTELAALCTPFEVVNLLNQLYTAFDTIIENYNVYKVETIGDSYMVVSGLPTIFESHAREISNMSLRLLEEITKGFVIPSKRHEKEILKLRIGLHSGPCCAGVVGTRNPRYCLFGDTVNMASRMESNGEACRIHCSEAFIAQISYLDEFIIERRGLINVKGKGSVNTFWLVGRKIEKKQSSVRSTIGFNANANPHTLAITKSSSLEHGPDESFIIEKPQKERSKSKFLDKIKDSSLKLIDSSHKTAPLSVTKQQRL